MAYHIARNNQQLGVFQDEDLPAKLASGELLPTDLAWTEGMADWKPLADCLPSPTAPPALAANPYAPPAAPTLAATGAFTGAPLASLGQRFGAALIDFGFFVAAYLPIILAVGLSAFVSAAAGQTPSDAAAAAPNTGLLALGGFLFLVLLIVNLVMLAKRGQTLGKRFVGIRIVAVDSDNHPGAVRTILLRSIVNGIISSVPLLGSVYALVDICFIFREDRRCIHDLLAGTRVVQGQPPLS